MWVEHRFPGPERWQKNDNKQSVLPNIKELRIQRERWGKFTDNQDTKQKGRSVARGMRGGGGEPLRRCAENGSNGMKLALRGSG